MPGMACSLSYYESSQNHEKRLNVNVKLAGYSSVSLKLKVHNRGTKFYYPNDNDVIGKESCDGVLINSHQYLAHF